MVVIQKLDSNGVYQIQATSRLHVYLFETQFGTVYGSSSILPSHCSFQQWHFSYIYRQRNRVAFTGITFSASLRSTLPLPLSSSQLMFN